MDRWSVYTAAAPAPEYLLERYIAVGVIGTSAATLLLSKASELDHVAQRLLSHIVASLKNGGEQWYRRQNHRGNVESSGGTSYRVASGIAAAAALVLVWMNTAVGIIGDGPVNLLYLGVLIVGIVGAFTARLKPRGMARALFATAGAQMLVPVIALVIWKTGQHDLLIDPNSPNPPFHPGIAPVFALNGVFAILWVVSALVFRKADRVRPKSGAV